MKIRTNGIEIHYVIEGNGPWVVMSHSLACDLHMWDPQSAALTDRYRVLRFDTRGHGQSDAPEGAYTLDMMADDLKGMLDGLGIESCHFVGLSMGGMIGQTFALKYPGRFRTLALCDTSSRYAPDSAPLWEARIRTAREQGMQALVEGTLSRWFTASFRENRKDVTSPVAATILATAVPGYAGCCQAIATINLTHRLKTISCPTLVLVGAEDLGTPVAMAREIQSAIPGAEMEIIPNACHLSNLEQPAAFNKALLRFLTRH